VRAIEYVTTDDTYQYIRRLASSFYADGQASTVVDDSAALQEYAERLQANAMNLAVSASFVIPFIHNGFELNDLITGIDEPVGSTVEGRDLSLQTNRDGAAAYPRIVRIVWDFQAQQTMINTTDDRESHF
jgi:hypothetical protein